MIYKFEKPKGDDIKALDEIDKAKYKVGKGFVIEHNGFLYIGGNREAIQKQINNGRP